MIKYLVGLFLKKYKFTALSLIMLMVLIRQHPSLSFDNNSKDCIIAVVWVGGVLMEFLFIFVSLTKEILRP